MHKHHDKNLTEQKVPSNKVESPSLLTANKARESLNNLHGWQLTDDHKMIYREFILLDFMTAVDLVDRIALIAEDEKHHPDIHLTQYRNLRIGLTTHDVGGLSQKDFTVALKINDLPIVTNKHNNGIAIDKEPQNKDKANKGRSKTEDQSNQPADKDKPKQKPRYEQKNLKLAPMKNETKSKRMLTKRSSNRIDQPAKKVLTFIFGLSLLCLGAFAQADDNRGDNHGDYHSYQRDNHRGDRYHYREGHWYGQGEVLVSDPAIGAVIETLPPQNTTVVVGNSSYYYDNTRYYSRSPDGTYIVVAAPRNR